MVTFCGPQKPQICIILLKLGLLCSNKALHIIHILGAVHKVPISNPGPLIDIQDV